MVRSISGTGRSGLAPASEEVNRGNYNPAANSSGPSSLVTDANSVQSIGPQHQQSTSINTDSYMRLPASPMSFSSNNISSSSMMDGSIVQQSSHHKPIQKQGASSATSQPTAQDQVNPSHPQKRPRLDMGQQDGMLQQQVIQQLLQRQESLQMQGHHYPQLQAIIQQQRLVNRQQQQQQMERAQMLQQNQQMRNHMQQQAMQPATPLKRSLDNGICARRLMQYMYHQRHRPADNSMLYWRKFVLEYYAPRAKKRWCLSLYDNVANHSLGIFPQTAMDAWQCDICGSNSGKGFEATSEVLPRLFQIKFDHGVIDELLFLDMPQECCLSNGMMVLKYVKAVQESVYEQVRVVREGQLQIIFTPELKIMSWEFCARRHEDYFSRRLVAPQVSQLLQVAQKYQAAVTESGSAGVSQQDLQSSCNMFLSAGRQLVKNMELQSLNDLGFSKRYVRCLQIAEVVNSMTDLIRFNQQHKIGPIESLKNYPRQAAAKLQNQVKLEVDQMLTAHSLPTDPNSLNKMMLTAHSLPTDPNSLNKMMPTHPSISSQLNTNLSNSRTLNNSAHGSVALNNYQNLFRSSMGLKQNTLQPNPSPTFNGPNPINLAQFQGGPIPSNLTSNLSINGLPTSNHHHQQQQRQQNYGEPSQVGQHLQQQQQQQQAIQQMLQEVMGNSNNRGGLPQQSSMTNVNGDAFSGVRESSVRMASGPARSGLGMGTNVSNHAMSRSNSMKSVSNNPTVSGNSLNSRGDLASEMQMPELDHGIVQEFLENGIFGGDAGDLGYGWKV